MMAVLVVGNGSVGKVYIFCGDAGFGMEPLRRVRQGGP